MAGIDGKMYENMVISAANALENQKEDINNLNVFPVPDGDTGSNMSMTMGVIREKAGSLPDKLSDCAAQISRMMLMAARGNSGVILSLFFKGMAKALDECDEADSVSLANAFKSGVESAYGAVMNPAEGTILTVMRVSAEKALEKAGGEYKNDPAGLMSYMLDVATKTLEETPEMLPVLKSANVVDAGGSGFVAILNGMRAALNNSAIAYTGTAKTKTVQSADFANVETGDIVFGYCTECIVEKNPEMCSDERIESLKETLSEMGDSMVFAQDEEIIKLHIHTNEPGIVLSLAQVFGALLTVKVENMRRQHTEMMAKTADKKTEEKAKEPESTAAEKDYGFVAVAAGEGIAAAFTDMGCDRMVVGGQTMNPSLSDIISAVHDVPAKTVFILPNNSNVYLAAVQAAKEIQDKRVIVLQTKTIPQGISALFAFDETATPEENEQYMTESVAGVKSFSLTYAVHDSTADGMDIKTGQSLGLLDGKVRFYADTDKECLMQMVKEMESGTTVTIFYGEDVTAEQAEEVRQLFAKALPMADVTMLPGGQPVYKYILMCE
ncbi:MAG: DAK2 domain-containing protein [Clostridiales bacterium]|nr:DAK2 domain-containing protein [Clostridiales bacterium]